MTAFYLKYRSQNLDELDLTEARESLSKIVASKKIPHAFLFAGPKGTGKTSAARIIAKIVNCLSKKTPCNKCDQCKTISTGNNLDVIELDAASNRGIDDVRALREAVKLAPAKAKKKVYIIDEAHMLTSEASNALLKTLEEPPSHVMFILATTNPEKLIETIRSRATFINFRKARIEEISRSLNRVVKGEKLKIDKETLLEIAKSAGGSFRDGIKILEQLVSEKIKLDKDSVKDFLFRTRIFVVEDFLSFLEKRETTAAVNQVEKLVEKGMQTENIISLLLERVRRALLAEVGIGEEKLEGFVKTELIELISLLDQAAREVKEAPIEQLPLEIAVIKWCDKESKDEKSVYPADGPKIKNETNNAQEDQQPAGRNSPAKVSGVTDEIWKDILGKIKPINTSIEALLRAARPVDFDGKTLTLGVYYRFHKERLEEGSQRKILEEVVAGILGNPVKVICTLTEPPVKKVNPEVPLTEGKDKDIIKIAEEIFGNV